MCVISSHQRVLWTTVFTDFALHFVTKNVKTENLTETVKLFALGLQYLELQRVLLIKSLFCLGKLKSSIFFFLKFLLDAPNLLTIFPLHRLTITVEFFLYSICFGRISQPRLPKMLRTVSSKASASTSLGMSITSRHSLLEYWAFAQHWHSRLAKLFDKSEFTCCETANSDWSFKKASNSLQISSSTYLLT